MGSSDKMTHGYDHQQLDVSFPQDQDNCLSATLAVYKMPWTNSCNESPVWKTNHLMESQTFAYGPQCNQSRIGTPVDSIHHPSPLQSPYYDAQHQPLPSLFSDRGTSSYPPSPFSVMPAFKRGGRVNTDPSLKNMWSLTEHAIRSEVEPTTRFRNNHGRKHSRRSVRSRTHSYSHKPATQRQISGRKGGHAARRSSRLRPQLGSRLHQVSERASHGQAAPTQSSRLFSSPALSHGTQQSQVSHDPPTYGPYTSGRVQAPTTTSDDLASGYLGVSNIGVPEKSLYFSEMGGFVGMGSEMDFSFNSFPAGGFSGASLPHADVHEHKADATGPSEYLAQMNTPIFFEEVSYPPHSRPFHASYFATPQQSLGPFRSTFMPFPATSAADFYSLTSHNRNGSGHGMYGTSIFEPLSSSSFSSSPSTSLTLPDQQHECEHKLQPIATINPNSLFSRHMVTSSSTSGSAYPATVDEGMQDADGVIEDDSATDDCSSDDEDSLFVTSAKPVDLGHKKWTRNIQSPPPSSVGNSESGTQGGL
ncbi:hypothetical protein FH972_026266 [Carpinus fangiana]|uniref:Uncharacterized protein n=1 Tax=Carpinus fangiana TaxID=176857 RepID=A0A5N6L3J3_9ROSI|nr:hypothetical protein FH972_026266 [Carpinus fangiana]